MVRETAAGSVEAASTGVDSEWIGMMSWQRDAEGIVTLVMDDRDHPVNTMNDTFIDSIEAVNDRLAAERDSVTGVILASAKSSWFAGGDLHELREGSSANAAADYARITRMKRQFRRLETLGRPVVAAINGTALGGGFEVALSCHHRIVADHPRTRLGLPEITLGLFPGAGGVTRTVRMLGLESALTTALLPGTRFTPRAARSAGLIDEVVGSVAELDGAARAWIAAHPDASQPWDREGFRIPGGSPRTDGVVPALAVTLPALPARLRAQLGGADYPAPRALLASAVEGAQVDIDTALDIETRYFVNVLGSAAASNMIGAYFFDLTAVTQGASRPADIPRTSVTTLGVVGAGMMGSAIAYTAARSGLSVVMTDTDPAAGKRAFGYAAARAVSAARRAHPELTEAEADRAADDVLARIRFTLDLTEVAAADLVVEAVYEDAGLKRDQLTAIEAAAGPGTILASNTSTIPIGSLASAVTRPHNVVGLHFFSPVDRMDLVEIVRAPETSDETLARAFDCARQLRKTPIVVNDSRGFFTSRVIFRFIEEALAALDEGVSPVTIERAARQAGYATPPLALIDELSLTLVARIWAENRVATDGSAPGTVWSPVAGAERALERMLSAGRPGRSEGAGFYDYADGRRGTLWTGLAAHTAGSQPGAGQTRTTLPPREPFVDLQERMLFAEALETVRSFDEGVLTSLADANIGSLLGIGYPPWTGGVMRYIEQYTGGIAGFVRRAEQLSDLYGLRFVPPASLTTLAESGGSLAAYATSPAAPAGGISAASRKDIP
ncbi:3-hydroxyacyl-CoA dehydrogenase NAD-binding domain-containing protein [Klugiella xanthotipulae]|uniref:3-hydroxyacyl-CoA dehydrogenase NAD-binding domain-containing protein n=1 Tax=Klugiella xanthotipulae TaxID=244735 RepID=UPI002482BF64|nr:3-hydroxyacyl-CoA dehydrogenase NAD-binding domain-containing protein [Klugiella xanthotipulae]